MSIIRQFLSQSQDGATILLKTGGQVIKYFFKLKIKTFIFKTKDNNSFSALRISEKEGEREALLKEALGKEFKITIPRGDILAMKADLGETWYKVRKLRR